jgi:hypothetical protein
MMTPPASMAGPGTSAKNSQPSRIAQGRSVYCSGETSAASASLSARVTQMCASIATTPRSDRSAQSKDVGVVHATGVTTAPISPAPTSCQNTSAVSGVPRSVRPVRTIAAKHADPKIAAAVAVPDTAPLGVSAISTPTNPIPMASQRRAPTRSPSRNGDTAAT